MNIFVGGALAFFVLMAVVIGTHEGGHYLAARLFGLRVSHFSIGFGPAFLKYTSPRSAIVYAIRVFPLGGSVQVASKGDSSLETMRALPKLLFYAAGPLANVALAFAIFATLHATDVIRPTPPIVTAFSEGSPSKTAGLQVGDRIVAIDGFGVSSWTNIMLISALAPKDARVQIDVERNDRPLSFAVQRANGAFGVIGQTNALASTFTQALSLAARDIRDNVSQIVVVPRILLFYKRSPVSAFSGPVGVAQAAGETAGSFAPFLDLALLIAAFSCGIAAANVLPIPVMDGGRIIQTIVERVFNAKTSERIESGLTYLSLAILLTLLVLTTSNDIARALHRPEFF